MIGDLSNGQLTVLSLLNIVGADAEYTVTPHTNGDLCILRPGTDEPLVTLNRYDYDNLFDRRILIATGTFYSEDESQKFPSTFRIQRR